MAGGHFGPNLKTVWLYIFKLMVMISAESQITADIQLVTFNLTIFFGLFGVCKCKGYGLNYMVEAV